MWLRKGLLRVILPTQLRPKGVSASSFFLCTIGYHRVWYSIRSDEVRQPIVRRRLEFHRPEVGESLSIRSNLGISVTVNTLGFKLSRV